MTTAEAKRYVLDVAERRAIVETLLRTYPRCAVGIVHPARSIAAAGPALAGIGIELGRHATLQATTLSEFVAAENVWLVAAAALEASVQGSATRTVQLRDGQQADLHLIKISDTEFTTVAIIVPGNGATIASTPPPTVVVASPRVGIIRCDAFAIITSASESMLVLLGRPGQPIEGTPIVQLLHPDEREMAIANWSAAKEQRGVALRWRCRVARVDGSWLWVEVTITNDIESDGSGEVRCDLNDVSAEVAAAEALVAERQLLVLLTETLPVGVAKFDAHGRVEHANRRLGELLAPLDPDQLLGQAVRGELHDRELAAAFASVVDDGVGSRLVVEHLGGDGVVRHLEWTVRPALGEDGAVTGGVVCVADVSEADRLRAALVAQANTDGLTGCLNRAGTVAALEHALAAVGPSEGVGLLFIDLDGFKRVNDSHGHAVGDAVLEVVASRLRAVLRPRDLVGRLGGDEFVVIAPGVRSAEAALAFANRVSQQLERSAVIADLTVAIEASIGVSWTSAGTASELLGAADAAMYTAKHTRAESPIFTDVPTP